VPLAFYDFSLQHKDQYFPNPSGNFYEKNMLTAIAKFRAVAFSGIDGIPPAYITDGLWFSEDAAPGPHVRARP